jgi:uncharacterized protein (TIGR00297 family)
MITGMTVIALSLAATGAAVVAATGQGTRAGSIAGLGVAILSILGLGPGTLLPLAIFVLGAGGLTRLGRARKEALGGAEANAGRRGVRHVAAKLSLPAVLGVAGIFGGGGRTLALAYAASLSAAMSDTAATEIGPLAGGPVAGIRGGRFQRLSHGTPGGMSAAGLAASAAGAAVVSSGAWLSGLIEGPAAWGVATGAGLLASVLESLLGGTAFGRALGHFGRNAMVSVVAGAVGFGVGGSWWGTR